MTTANYPGASGDGDDRSALYVKRTYAAADVGTGIGQTRDTTGVDCLMAQLPPGLNVLSFFALTYRPTNTKVYTMDDLVSLVTTAAGGNITSATLSQADINYWIDANNCLRMVDAGATAAVQIAPGDYTVVIVVSGPGTPHLG